MLGDKFINKYRIDSIRLPDWNYGDDGYYFVTICTKNREYYFGEVLVDNSGEYSVALTAIGKIVRDELLKTTQIRSNIKLDEWVIMPNHIHAIIIIDNCRDALHASHLNNKMSTYHDINRDARSASLQGGGEYKNTFGPQRNNLASIIRGFKSATQSQIEKQFGLKKIWQPRFYDHIIRTERALHVIRYYININPKNWNQDCNNPENLLM